MNNIDKQIKYREELIKEYQKWYNELEEIEADKEQYILDRYSAFENRKKCLDMIAAISNQLFSYKQIDENIKKNKK